ncbi:uncharacterized protein LOC128194644 [Vigna angularis]|uniref:uncharacterized protein LOC128194644 n=1 Tax=Phaseolus angularis TaxID=3914 RepID=UPI0022B4425D|nr:uncharacterized protein LOC128194644 [Vigna angularis]
MDEGETVAEYFDKVQELVNKMRACKDAISDEYIVEKILRTLTPRFDHVVVAIEEARNLESMEIEELLHSLEAHEYRINERKQCQEQALQARSQLKGKKGFKKWSKGSKKGKDSQEQQGEDSSEFVTVKNQKAGGEWKFDKKKVKCYNCQKLGHYAKECWKGEGAKNKPKKRANMARKDESDSEAVMLMANTGEEQPENTTWYLDSGCSTHMIGRKDWFVRMHEAVQGKIRFADDKSLTAEGSVPGLKTNLLSLGQLLQKGYVMKMENNCLSIFNQHKKMIVQAQLSQNRTFRVVMSAVKHQCFTATENKEE